MTAFLSWLALTGWLIAAVLFRSWFDATNRWEASQREIERLEAAREILAERIKKLESQKHMAELTLLRIKTAIDEAQ